MTPLERFTAICEAQGRKFGWVAERAGITLPQLYHKFRGRRGFPWHRPEQEAIAAALGVPVTFIWPEADEAKSA